MKTKLKCPWCEGTGKNLIRESLLRENPNDPQIDCYLEECMLCEGTGKVTQEEINHQECLESLWCRCREPLRRGEAIDYDPKTNCWTCGKCGKVYQTG